MMIPKGEHILNPVFVLPIMSGWLDIPQIVSHVMGNVLLHLLLFLHVITLTGQGFCP